MIKQGIRNFFKNLKYIFTPLGAIALGLVFGLSLGIPIVHNSLSNLVESIVKVSENTQIQLQDLINGILQRINSLDWNSPLKSLAILLDRTWITSAINDCVTSISVDITELEGYIQNCIDEIAFAFKVFVFFVILGFIGGYFFTKWLIRREIAKRKLWKYFLAAFIDSLLSATLVSLCVFILALWKPGAIISAFVSIVLFEFIQLFEAYAIHAWKKTDVSSVISIKNIAKLFASDILIFFVAAAFVAIVIAVTNTLVGLFVGIALLEIAYIVIGLNAEAYVKGLVQKIKDGEAQPKK